jgi:hypothetical protein
VVMLTSTIRQERPEMLGFWLLMLAKTRHFDVCSGF